MNWVILAVIPLLLAACSNEPTPTIDIEGTVVARVQATVEAMPTNTSIPTVTPTELPEPTLIPTPSEIPRKTPTPLPTNTMVPIVTPTVVSSATPALTFTPLPTPSPTFTPTSTPTATASPTATVPPIESIAAQSKDAIVKITAGTDSQGSGVIISRDGNILTANHVVEEVEVIDVELLDGRRVKGTVLGRHLGADLALINIPLEGLTTIEFADPHNLQIGEVVIKLGYALGLSGDPSVSLGIVSAFRTEDRYGIPLIQTDAVLNPGDSGGPLLNREGNIVGISTSKMVDEAVEGIGFAVAASEAIDNMAQMAASELICPPIPDLAEGSFSTYGIFGFSIKRPTAANWEAVQDDDGSLITGRIGSGAGTATVRLTTGVVIPPPHNRGDFSDLRVFRDERIASRAAFADEFVLSRIRSVCRTDGSLAYEVEARTVLGGADFIERWLVLFEGGQAYVLIGLATPQTWASQETFIDTVLYSFGFR